MKKSKYSEAQMIEALKQVEAGRGAEEVGRAQHVSLQAANFAQFLVGRNLHLALGLATAVRLKVFSQRSRFWTLSH